MKQVVVASGAARVVEVPAPMPEPGAVVVRVDFSCISTGTELSGIKASGLPLWRRALAQPQKAQAALRAAAAHGLRATWAEIERRSSAQAVTGYSAAGVVAALGKGIEDLQVGDRVACAGAQFAHHAEVVRVPRNLVTVIPDGVETRDAATVALGAIALQGVRRAQVTLGETFAVIGLGILGQLTTQLLTAAGCRVLALDLDDARVALAETFGAVGLRQDGDDAVQAVARVTNGIGADGVIITAASSTDEIVSRAFRMTRKRGRVVLVGDVGLNLNRADFYEKEIDFLISTSYGPGRYDRRYEEQGFDYPPAYVRWTENRNMGEFLSLIAAGRVRLDPLGLQTFPIDLAEGAYASLSAPGARPLAVLLEYPGSPAAVVASRTIPLRRVARRSDELRIALIGAGAFAKSTHLPILRSLSGVRIHAVASRSGVNATATARDVGAAYATTDAASVLEDPDIDAVIIATRHNLHASLGLAALRSGKHVLVEKPLALTRAELAEIAALYSDDSVSRPVLLTGFNRRFSPCARRMRELCEARIGPLMVSYTMNAGYIPLDHWVHGEEGGGRNIGEACHVYDLFGYLVGSRVRSVDAAAIRPGSGYARSDNFVATVTFEEGSVAALAYTALGNSGFPKESADMFCDRSVISLDDFRRVEVAGIAGQALELGKQDKGWRSELAAFVAAAQGRAPWPISLEDQLQAMTIAFDVQDRIDRVAG